MKKNGLIDPVTSILKWDSDLDKDCKYIGKEEIDGKKYIIYSLEYERGMYKDIYYIDAENSVISKIEKYENSNSELKLTSLTNYTYSYNTVTDDDINKFNVNNYAGYQYLDEY